MTPSPPPCQTPNPPDPPPDIPDGTLIRRSDSLENEDSDEASTRGKKQKTLSSLADTSASAKSKKKSKKKSNNVWTKPTSRKGKKKSKASAQTNPSAPQDTVLITPIPRFPDKSDDSPGATICLSRAYKAEKVELSEDRMTAGSTKGYRMVRATRGVSEGAWYFEVKVVRLGETGHTRLGWTTDKGDLQAPVGYDGNSYGYRDVDGSKVHKALREKYGEEGYFEGDAIGFYINLPEGHLYEPKPPHLVWYKGQRYMYPADGKDDPPKVIPGSEISFFKNGICQGVAYADLFGGRYYPAASMYTLPNQSNCEVRFNFGPDFEFFPQDFGSRPIPRHMVEVPYHGYDGRAEGATSNGLSENTTVATNGLPDRTVSANGLSEEMIASVNNVAEGAAVAANCKAEETTEIANIQAEEATALTNGLVEEDTALANGPVEEMVLDANGLTNE